MKAVLTIAGSDSSGGAGIQADLKTIIAHRLFGESVITALTAQNTTGVFGVMDVDPAFVGAQMDAVFDDIRPDAVKIGMVSSPDIVRAIADAGFAKAHLPRRNAAKALMIKYEQRRGLMARDWHSFEAAAAPLLNAVGLHFATDG